MVVDFTKNAYTSGYLPVTSWNLRYQRIDNFFFKFEHWSNLDLIWNQKQLKTNGTHSFEHRECPQYAQIWQSTLAYLYAQWGSNFAQLPWCAVIKEFKIWNQVHFWPLSECYGAMAMLPFRYECKLLYLQIERDNTAQSVHIVINAWFTPGQPMCVHDMKPYGQVNSRLTNLYIPGRLSYMKKYRGIKTYSICDN